MMFVTSFSFGSVGASDLGVPKSSKKSSEIESKTLETDKNSESSEAYDKILDIEDKLERANNKKTDTKKSKDYLERKEMAGYYLGEWDDFCEIHQDKMLDYKEKYKDIIKDKKRAVDIYGDFEDYCNNLVKKAGYGLPAFIKAIYSTYNFEAETKDLIEEFFEANIDMLDEFTTLVNDIARKCEDNPKETIKQNLDIQDDTLYAINKLKDSAITGYEDYCYITNSRIKPKKLYARYEVLCTRSFGDKPEFCGENPDKNKNEHNIIVYRNDDKSKKDDKDEEKQAYVPYKKEDAANIVDKKEALLLNKMFVFDWDKNKYSDFTQYLSDILKNDDIRGFYFLPDYKLSYDKASNEGKEQKNCSYIKIPVSRDNQDLGDKEHLKNPEIINKEVTVKIDKNSARDMVFENILDTKNAKALDKTVVGFVGYGESEENKYLQVKSDEQDVFCESVYNLQGDDVSVTNSIYIPCYTLQKVQVEKKETKEKLTKKDDSKIINLDLLGTYKADKKRGVGKISNIILASILGIIIVVVVIGTIVNLKNNKK